MYACLHGRMYICQFNYYFFLDGCEWCETCIYIVFLSIPFSCIHTDLLNRYRFLVFIPILCIGTLFMYTYRSLVSVLFSCKVISFMFTTWHAITCLLTPACYYLTLVRYHLSPAMSDTCLIIITIREWWLDILTYPDIFTQVQTILLIHMYSWYMFLLIPVHW